MAALSPLRIGGVYGLWINGCSRDWIVSKFQISVLDLHHYSTFSKPNAKISKPNSIQKHQFTTWDDFAVSCYPFMWDVERSRAETQNLYLHLLKERELTWAGNSVNTSNVNNKRQSSSISLVY